MDGLYDVLDYHTYMSSWAWSMSLRPRHATFVAARVGLGRSGMYTKYCMKAQLKTQRSALSAVATEGQRDSYKDGEATLDEISSPADQPTSNTTMVAVDEAAPPADQPISETIS